MLTSDSLQVSDIFHWTMESKAKTIVHQGGTYSGKTYNILIALFCKAISEPSSIITVVAQDVPRLKSGALRDTEKIIKASEAFQQEIVNHNKTDRIFYFRNSSVMEFKSVKDDQDARGGKREYLFVNEANAIPFDVYTQLALRTSKQVILDFNPSELGWINESVIGQPGTDLFISDHRHNPFIDQSIRDKIEALKDTDYDLWRVYGRGLTGKFEGLVYSNYQIVGSVPDEATLIGGALDWGYSNDPTAFLLVYKYNGELWIDELIYETGLTNPDIAERLRVAGVSRTLDIVADSAEPKSIKELSAEGFYVTPARKGPDSIRIGIDVLKRFRMNITSRSHGIIKELKRYKWRVDKDGKALNEPVGFFNHSLDALRYLGLNKLTEDSKSLGQYCWA